MSVYPGPYKFAVDFEKKLTSKALNGLTIRDRVYFATENDANSWIKAVSSINRDGQYYNLQVVKV
jgi:hypothetical protein